MKGTNWDETKWGLFCLCLWLWDFFLLSSWLLLCLWSLLFDSCLDGFWGWLWCWRWWSKLLLNSCKSCLFLGILLFLNSCFLFWGDFWFLFLFLSFLFFLLIILSLFCKSFHSLLVSLNLTIWSLFWLFTFWLFILFVFNKIIWDLKGYLFIFIFFLVIWIIWFLFRIWFIFTLNFVEDTCKFLGLNIWGLNSLHIDNLRPQELISSIFSSLFFSLELLCSFLSCLFGQLSIRWLDYSFWVVNFNCGISHRVHLNHWAPHIVF